MRASGRSEPTRRPHAAWASSLLFLSGATSLAYELLWFRRFAHTFGSSALAMAAVLAAFLLGLGLGARLLGRRADRMRRPLLGYAACEAGIAICALLMPAAVSAAARAAAQLERVLPELPGLPTALQLLMATLVLAPPCVLMGATLPLCVRQFSNEREGLGGTTAWLYAANTLGAAVGVWVVGFHLLPTLGTTGTNLVALACNLAVALAAVPLSLAEPPPSDSAPHVASTTDAPLRPTRLALAAGAVGFATLALEIVWARQLAVILGGSTYAFTAMLGTALVGIGLGSLALRAWLARGGDPLRLFGASTALLAVSLIAGQHAIPALTEAVGALFERRASPAFNAALASLVSAALELVPCACAGLVFPLLVHLAGGGPPSAGSVVGRVYLWNTLGTAAGAILAHAALVPHFGSRTTLLVALALDLAAFALVAASAPARARAPWLAMAAGVLGLALLLAPRHDPLATERGLYVYGPAGFDALAGAQQLQHSEGANANVLVTSTRGIVSLRLNGKVDASSHVADQVTQLGSAYLPRFLRPAAQDVCIIGYGSGATAGASLLFPGARVVCVEIEPEVFAASEHFADVNHEPDQSPDFEIRFEDGRAFLQRTERRFDLILTEPSNPWIAGVASLFTREFLQTARARLSEGGLLGQWIQTYALSPEDYRVMLRTLSDVFPHLALLRLTSGDTMVLASEQPILRGLADAEHAQRLVDSLHAVREDLLQTFETSDVRTLLARELVLGGDQLRALAAADGRDTLNTDSNLRLEFDAPLRLFERETEPGATVDAMLLAGVDLAFQRELAVALGNDPRAAPGFLELARALRERGHADLALGLVELASELDPAHPSVLAEHLLLEPPERAALEARIESLLALSTSDAFRVALGYESAGDLPRARAALDVLVRERPDSVTARAQRALVMAELGELDAARAELAALMELDPLNETLREAVRRLRAR